MEHGKLRDAIRDTVDELLVIRCSAIDMPERIEIRTGTILVLIDLWIAAVPLACASARVLHALSLGADCGIGNFRSLQSPRYRDRDLSSALWQSALS